MLGVVTDAAGTVVAEDREESPEGFDDIIESAEAMIAALRGRAEVKGAGEVRAVGVGIAGLVDGEGVLRYGPNLPGVVDAPVRATLAALLAATGVDELMVTTSTHDPADRLRSMRLVHDLFGPDLPRGLAGTLTSLPA